MCRFIAMDERIVVFEDDSWEYEDVAYYDESRDCTLMTMSEGIDRGFVDPNEVFEL